MSKPQHANKTENSTSTKSKEKKNRLKLLAFKISCYKLGLNFISTLIN